MKIRHGQNVTQNDTKCIIYTRRISHRATQSTKIMHMIRWVTLPHIIHLVQTEIFEERYWIIYY